MIPRVGPAVRNGSFSEDPEHYHGHVEQRWFVGAHVNVGGGYENELLA